MFRTEVEILVKVGVLKEENYSEWGAPSFAKPKAKTNRIRFSNNLRNLNRKLKLNPYPMPKIREMVLNLGGLNTLIHWTKIWVIIIYV